MKNSIAVTLFIISALSLTAFMSKGTTAHKKAATKADEKGFAVLELFTSEGCSSCPPADELLAKIQKENEGKPVYLLAYHVDYWNHQGWKDIFSSADFSGRQIQYGQWLGGSQIYTPQLIINGKAEFVGSDEPAIRGAIAEQLATNARASLSLHAQQNGEELKVQYQAVNVVKGSNLLIALVQKNAQSKVARGENAGHTLSHVQIVHKFQTEVLNTNGNGSTAIALPKGFNNKEWEVLGLIQDPASGEILAAARVNPGADTIIK